MSLSGNRLGDAITDAALASVNGATSGDENTFRASMRTIFGAEVVKEFVDNAETDSNGQTEAHASGAAATINNLPGTVS